MRFLPFALCALFACTFETPPDVPDPGDPIACPNGPSDCPQPAEASCGEALCTDGYCGMTFEANGATLPAAEQMAGDCATWVCDGTGGKRRESANDPEDDQQPCTMDVCVDGVTQHPPQSGFVDCYTGEAGTLGVGRCIGGMQQCSNGVPMGACVGEVIPTSENCDTARVDEDCDGSINEEGAACICSPNETTACYTGMAGTRGVGQCMDGTWTCNDQGLGYTGPCAGQTLPAAAEVCDGSVALVDENCSGMVDEGCVCKPNATVECAYSGPAGTQNVGACKAANRMCNSTGKGYATACSGEVLPTYDWCTTAPDENCNGSAAACTGKWVYETDAVGSPIYTDLLAVAPDGTSVLAKGIYSLRLEKVSPTGSQIWLKNFDGNNQYLQPHGITIDGNGSIIVVGMIATAMNFGCGTIAPFLGEYYNGDAFVVKFDSAGNCIWSKLFDPGVASPSYGYARSVAVDSSGNIVVVGNTNGGVTMDYGGGPLPGGSNNCDDGFIAKFSAAGAHQWSRRYTNPAGCYSERIYEVEVDGAGNAYTRSDNLNMVATNLHNVAKFDVNGNVVTTFPSYPSTLAVSASGNVTLVGTGLDITTYNTSGTLLWRRNFAAPGNPTSRGVSAATASDGSIVIAATFGVSSPDLGFGAPQPAADYLGIVKLSSTGVPQYAEYARNVTADQYNAAYVLGVRFDSANNIYLMGSTSPTATNGTLAGKALPAATYRRFVVQLDPP